MRSLGGVAAATLWFAVSAVGQRYVGSTACAACHPEQAVKPARSAHSRALSRPLDHALAERFEAASLLREPDFEFTLSRVDDRLETSVRRGDESRRVVIDWAFGAGDQAVTFVSRVDEDWHVEHYWSYYSADDGFDASPGHQASQASDLDEALGVAYRTFSPKAEILRCFGCHSTGPLALDEDYGVRPAELGVRCEACHGAGSEHAAAASAGAADAAAKIANPGRLAPDDLLSECGTCHRPPAQEPAEVDFADPWNVRHQPLYLVRSACYRRSGTLTCLSCHDAHDDVVRDSPAFYRERCLGCHEGGAPIAAACGEPATADCAGCHMPQAAAGPRLAFTNHWIGVFSGRDSLIPRRGPLE